MSIGDVDPHFDPERSRNIHHWSEKDPFDGFPKINDQDREFFMPRLTAPDGGLWINYVPKNDEELTIEEYQRLDPYVAAEWFVNKQTKIRQWSENDMKIGKIEPLVVSEFEDHVNAGNDEWKRIKEALKNIDHSQMINGNNDPIDHPQHYKTLDMEAIDIIEMIISNEKNPKVSYNMSNVLKYLLRFRHKGKAVEDMKKARWYLDRMIMHLEGESKNT